MSFDCVADGLYALAPGDFVAARTAAEKQARSDGDRKLATRIHQLAKPTVVGWLANQLVRRHSEEIGPLLELGEGLRDATAALSGQKLQELTRLQHQVIAGLIKQARQLAKEAEQRVSDDAVRGLEDTLRAALADENLAAQLSAGRLTGGLEHVGFAGGFDAQAVPQPAAKQAPAKTAAKRPDELAARRKAKLAEAERAASAAREESRGANRARKQAQAQLEKASRAAALMTEKVEKLQNELDRVAAERDEAAAVETDAQKAVEKAESEAARRRKALDDAQAALEDLNS